MKTILGIILIGMLLNGCDENPLKKYHGNTVFRVENCMKETSSKLIDEDIIRKTCVKKIQESVDDEITGKAGVYKRYSYSNNDEEKLYMKATIKNSSTNIVYTQFKIKVYHTIDYGDKLNENCNQKEHNSCNKIIYSMVFDDLWLQPNSEEKFELNLNEKNFNKHSKLDGKIKLQKINFQTKDIMDGKDLIRKSNWSWSINSTKGVLIK